jgi:hypothetical protein
MSGGADVVAFVEAEYLPRFRTVRDRLATEFPHLQFTVSTSTVGSATRYRCYVIHLECIVAPKYVSQPDSVALSVDLCHLTTAPRIMADVCWGHSSGHVEASLVDGWSTNDDWPEATPENLARVLGALPVLEAAFERAARRGEPGATGGRGGG